MTGVAEAVTPVLVTGITVIMAVGADVRSAVPSVGTAHAPRTAPAFAGPPSAQAGQGAGDGVGGIVLCGAHYSILHAT